MKVDKLMHKLRLLRHTHGNINVMVNIGEEIKEIDQGTTTYTDEHGVTYEPEKHIYIITDDYFG